MALAHRPQAHDEPHRVRRHTRLVGMRNDRRIEQGRLQTVFAHEIGANQQGLAVGWWRGRQEVAELAAAIDEDSIDVRVLVAEMRHHAAQLDLRRGLGHGQDPLDRVPGALVAAGMKRPEQHAGVVRAQI